MLAEAVAKQLKPVYCTRCGSRLQVRKLRQNGFDKDTGYPKYDITLACPYVTLYETDIWGETRFTWKDPLDKHTVHKISKVIELDSDIVGTSYMWSDYGKTIADFDKLIKLDPNNADAYRERGDFYCEMDKYGEAIADYTRAIELEPRYALAYFNRAYAYGEIGEYDKAIADYSKTIELDPKDAQAYYNRGLDCQNKGEMSKAVNDLEKCVGLSTDPELIKDAQQALSEIKNS